MATAKPTPRPHVVATLGPLQIVTFRNRSGSTSYRVQGTIHGERIRKNFSHEAAARIFAQERTKGLVGGTTRRTVVTSLADQQLSDAEAFFHDLPANTSPRQVLKFYIDHHRPIKGIPFETAAVENGAKVERKLGAVEVYADWCLDKRKNLEKTVEQRKFYVNQFIRRANITVTTEITEETASPWLYDRECSARTQRDRFDELNRFCKFLVKRKHLLSNPLADLPRPIVRLKAPSVLTFEQIWTLLQCALTDAEGPGLLPFFSIASLSGVRPDEVKDLGTKADGTKTDGWDDIHLADEHHVIEVNKAKGGQSRRNADISDSLWRILTWCKEQKLAANYFSKRMFDRIRKNAGVFDNWENDILRHSYASYHYALHKDVKTLSFNMGNTERVLFEHYIRAVARAEAVAYSGIVLHWSAPRRRSMIGIRIDRMLVKPVEKLTLEQLRILNTRLSGELAKLRRNNGSAAEIKDTESKLHAVRGVIPKRVLAQNSEAVPSPKKAHG